MEKISIFWFRRDLRLEDNHALFQALSSGNPVVPIFIFDKNILDQLANKNKKDKRVQFIFDHLQKISNKLNQTGSGVEILYGTPEQAFNHLLKKLNISAVYTNEDYEPYAKERDKQIKNLLENHGIAFHTFKDQVIFNPEEILKESGAPFQIYSPYARKWLEKLPDKVPFYDSESLLHHALKFVPESLALKAIGFETAESTYYPIKLEQDFLKNYYKSRQIPSFDGTSRVSVHLRFGTISIRKLVEHSRNISTKFLRELIWREFFMMMIYHYASTAKNSFKPAYDRIVWKNNEEDFEKWKNGNTGFPLVDAGMRELNSTGYMHNRVRMLTASFLIKDLLIDWRWGEAYFAEKLLDYDMSQNIGNWQWCAGSGCDAAPYFRIFNPDLQLKKFDPNFEYVKRWVPTFGTSEYPEPMVDHNEARKETLATFTKALKGEI